MSVRFQVIFAILLLILDMCFFLSCPFFFGAGRIISATFVNFVYLFQVETLFHCLSAFISTDFGAFNFLLSVGFWFILLYLFKALEMASWITNRRILLFSVCAFSAVPSHLSSADFDTLDFVFSFSLMYF